MGSYPRDGLDEMKHEASVYAFSAPSFLPPSRAAEAMDVEGGDEPPDSEAIGEEGGAEESRSTDRGSICGSGGGGYGL